jgi:hypothetical protein
MPLIIGLHHPETKEKQRSRGCKSTGTGKLAEYLSYKQGKLQYQVLGYLRKSDFLLQDKGAGDFAEY